MKRSIKAALLSALVFPGLGQFLLGRTVRAFLFLLPSAVAAVYIAGNVLERANAIVEQVQSGTLPLDPQRLSEQISAAPGSEGPMMTVAVVVAVVCWAGSVADALMLRER